MKPILNADGTLTVEGGTMTIAGVERLIYDLALARSRMQPEVPIELPTTGETTVVTMNDPHVIVSRAVDETLTVGFRHSGYGWCVFLLTERSATFLRNALNKRLEAVPAAKPMDVDLPTGDAKH